jgi:tetratricopeptide (TPR) repeat protein
LQAIISGQAGLAVVASDDERRAYSAVTHDCIPVADDIFAFLAGCKDLLFELVESVDEALLHLDVQWRLDRALQLSLILLSEDEPAEIRSEAATCLDQMFSDASVRNHVANHLYSHPLPLTADVRGARYVAQSQGADHVAKFVAAVHADQAEITRRSEAWDELPSSLFATDEQRRSMRAELVRAGAFRVFVEERAKKDWALYQLLSDPALRGKAKMRAVLQAWAAPFRSLPDKLATMDDEPDYSLDTQYVSRRISGHAMFENVGHQKEAIKSELLAGNEERALRFTDALIQTQKQYSEREHLAKSLCDLAQYAKELGSAQIQLRFAELATREVPDDSWAHATVADAHRALGNFSAALAEYQRAHALGDHRIGILGHAEVLKDLGQLDGAMALYDECILKFDEPVARNARAAALGHFGLLDRALAAYDAILQETPYDSVALSGRATVLRNIGRVTEAEEELRRISETFPNDYIPLLALAELLRTLDRLQEAEDLYRTASRRFPLHVEAQVGVARVLIDRGNVPDGIREFERAREEFPVNKHVTVAFAEALRHVGQIPRAERLYEELAKGGDNSPRLRVGLARIRTARGRYDEALALLPAHPPSTYSEWLAEHVRALVHIRKGSLGSAEEILTHAIAENPWRRQRPLFEAALSALRLQQRRPAEAISVLSTDAQTAWLRSLFVLLRMHAMHYLQEHSSSAVYPPELKRVPINALHRLHSILETPMDRQAEHSAFIYECDSLLLAA